MTRLRTGVYGITALSPSLSVARVSGRIAYTAREEGKHSIYAIDDPVKLAGAGCRRRSRRGSDGGPGPPRRRRRRRSGRRRRRRSGRGPSAAADARGAAPARRRAPAPARAGSAGATPASGSAEASGTVPDAEGPRGLARSGSGAAGRSRRWPDRRRQRGAPALSARREPGRGDARRPETGLPGAGTPPTQPSYEPKLQLQHVGQPSIGVGVDRFGTYAAGSTALYFGDMLGNRNLAVALQTSASCATSPARSPTRTSTRGSTGASGRSTCPTCTPAATPRRSSTPTGVPLIVDEYLMRQTDVALFGVAAYPISRADRFELQTTFRRYSFSAERRTDVYSYQTGEFLGQDETRIDTGLEPLYLGALSGAFVHDTSVFGAASPILGQRGRSRWAQTAGSRELRGRARRLARVLHARAAGDARAARDALRPLRQRRERRALRLDLSRLPELHPRLRRHRGERVRPRRDRAPARSTTGCSAAGCWWRTPSCAPRSVACSGDASTTGRCRSRSRAVRRRRRRLGRRCGPGAGTRAPASATAAEPVGGEGWSSVGVAGRVNVLGFLVLEVSYARPFQRSGKGWVWQWNLAPGF